ncbi:unnamed protein product [Phaeothamnion confervicola]
MPLLSKGFFLLHVSIAGALPLRYISTNVVAFQLRGPRLPLLRQRRPLAMSSRGGAGDPDTPPTVRELLGRLPVAPGPPKQGAGGALDADQQRQGQRTRQNGKRQPRRDSRLKASIDAGAAMGVAAAAAVPAAGMTVKSVPAPSTAAAETVTTTMGGQRRAREKRGKPVSLSRGDAVRQLEKILKDFRSYQSIGPPATATAAAAALDVAAQPSPPEGSIDDFVNLAKSCLHSSLPDLAVECYSLYRSASGSRVAAGALLPDFQTHGPLLVTTMRAHMMMENLAEALVMLAEARRHGVLFESHANSLLLTAMCGCGPRGLSAALGIRAVMKAAGQMLTLRAALALLEALATGGAPASVPSLERWYGLLRRESYWDAFTGAEPGGGRVGRAIGRLAGVGNGGGDDLKAVFGQPFDPTTAILIAEDVFQDIVQLQQPPSVKADGSGSSSAGAAPPASASSSSKAAVAPAAAATSAPSSSIGQAGRGQAAACMVRAAFRSSLARLKVAGMLRDARGAGPVDRVGVLTGADAMRDAASKGRLAAAASRAVAQKWGLQWDFSTTTALLEECLACNFTAGAEEALATMRREGLYARTSTYNALLRYFRDSRDAEGALRTLRMLQRSRTVQPDAESFSLAIQTCAWSGNCIAEAFAVMKEASRSRVAGLFSSKPMLDARLILTQVAGGDIDKELRQMVSTNVSPDEQTFVGVIDACTERCDVEGAWEILQRMRAVRFGAAAVANAAESATAAAGGAVDPPAGKARAISVGGPAAAACTAPAAKGEGGGGEDVELFVAPSFVTYMAVLLCTKKARDCQTAQKVLALMWQDSAEMERMAAATAAARSSEGTGAIAAQFLTAKGGASVRREAWTLLLPELLLAGPIAGSAPPWPTEVCYRLVVECCAEARRVDAALQVFSDMEQRGLQPSEPIYAAVMRGFGADLQLSSALGVWEELSKRWRPPSRASFEAAIDCCVTHPNGLQSAGMLINQMKLAGFDLSADHFRLLIRGFGEARNLEAALEVFREMKYGAMSSLGWEVGEDTFAVLIEACMRGGDAASVPEAIAILRSHGVKPPRQIMQYLGVNRKRSELYDRIFGPAERERQKSRERRYGTRGRALMTGVGGSELEYDNFTELLEKEMEGLDQAQYEAASATAAAGSGGGEAGKSRVPVPTWTYKEIDSREDRIASIRASEEAALRSKLRKEQGQGAKGGTGAVAAAAGPTPGGAGASAAVGEAATAAAAAAAAASRFPAGGGKSAHGAAATGRDRFGGGGSGPVAPGRQGPPRPDPLKPGSRPTGGSSGRAGVARRDPRR